MIKPKENQSGGEEASCTDTLKYIRLSFAARLSLYDTGFRVFTRTNKVCMYLSLDNYTDKKGILSPSGVHNHLLLAMVKYLSYIIYILVCEGNLMVIIEWRTKGEKKKR